MNKLTLTLLAVSCLLLSQPLYADPLDKIQFLKISEPEGKAVIKGSDGKLRMVGVGEVINSDQRSAEKQKIRAISSQLSAKKAISTQQAAENQRADS